MKHSSKKQKKRSRSSSNQAATGGGAAAQSHREINNNSNNDINISKEEEEDKVLKGLMEAFTSVSLDEALGAYREANCDLNRAAEILGCLSESKAPSCSSLSSSSGLSSSSTRDQGLFVKAAKQKKVIAATGTVSTVIGKDYVMSTIPRKGGSTKGIFKYKGGGGGYSYEPATRADAEQFLCSMLGEDCQLSLAVVRDVLCQCGDDVEKALNVLLELCVSSYECSESGQIVGFFEERKEDTQFFLEGTENLTDRASDSTSHTSESENQDNEWTAGYRYRNYSEVLTGSRVNSKVGSLKSELPEKVLEALFNMPKHSEHEPKTMKWRDVVKKIESLGQKFECPPSCAAEPELVHAKGDEYQVFRKAARENWDVMKSCYQKAATAFSNGERDYAAYLSEQGRVYNRIAREADEKASKEIFRARNKSIENVITIDLHGQHVKQAMRLLKVHLAFGGYVCSVQTFRVITGCGGSQGVGKSKLKQRVIDLVKREEIKWREENHGTILIRLDGQRHFAFLESEDDSE